MKYHAEYDPGAAVWNIYDKNWKWYASTSTEELAHVLLIHLNMVQS